VVKEFRIKRSWWISYNLAGIVLIAMGVWAISLFFRDMVNYHRLIAGIVIIVFVGYIVIDRNLLKIRLTDNYVARIGMRATCIKFPDATELFLKNGKAFVKSEKSSITISDEITSREEIIHFLAKKAVECEIPISGDDYMLEKYWKPLKRRD
jgi:hypothetical protein